MKKFWIWMIPLISVAIISSGIVIGLNFGKNISNKTIFATDIYWKIPSIEIENGDSFTISKNEIAVEPANCTQKIIFTTNDNEMLTINPQTGETVANKVGECEIIATINSSETTKKVVKINVTVVSNENPQKDKNIYEVTKTFNIFDEFANLQFQSGSQFDKCSYEIVSGADCIEIAGFSKNRIDIIFKNIGNAEIVIDSPTDTTYFYISIE